MSLTSHTTNPHPRILVFFCSHCQGRASASLPLSIASADASVTTVHFTCARDVGTEDIRRGFEDGADGVLICGCLVRNCTTSADDLRVLRDLYRNQIVLKSMGLETDRLREEWVLQGTTDHLDNILSDFSHQLRELGPAMPHTTAPSLDADVGRA